jgi:hypothetical protein
METHSLQSSFLPENYGSGAFWGVSEPYRHNIPSEQLAHIIRLREKGQRKQEDIEKYPLPPITWISATEEEIIINQEKIRLHNEYYYPQYYPKT